MTQPGSRRVDAVVIGAGPGGMSAAYYLALKGYSVRVIEEQSVAGGMLLLGIPRYRLPREVIDREVVMLKNLGVEFQFDTAFGTDITLAQLKSEGFEAFFFAIKTKLNILTSLICHAFTNSTNTVFMSKKTPKQLIVYDRAMSNGLKRPCHQATNLEESNLGGTHMTS